VSVIDIRLMSQADIPQAAIVALTAFEMDAADPDVHSRWQKSLAYRLATDPGGSFVSEHQGAVVGVAQALIRDRLWILSLLSVSPTLERPGGGDGRALINAGLAYGRDTAAGMIMASNDPRALRLYGSSGFALEPAFEAKGRVDPDRIPRTDPDITQVAVAAIPELAPISRALRGAAHTQDLENAVNGDASLFRLRDRGFVMTTRGRGVSLLAALAVGHGRVAGSAPAVQVPGRHSGPR
jgi:ribosomal protein S18 acetylase RimI-like enzyme